MKNFIVGLLILLAGTASACDICATHVALTPWTAPQRLNLSIFEQYSEYDRPSSGGHRYKSSTTQVGAGYRFTDRWAVQLSVPYLDRKLDGDTESGLGDIALLGIFRLLDHTTEKHIRILDLYAGLKMPTGDSDPLKEERNVAKDHNDNHHDHAGHDHANSHADHDGGHAHGHHLALGSGSWDGIFGAQGIAQRGRWRALADAQYIARTEGDYDYEYGDEFIARGGLRYHLVLEHTRSVAAGFDLTREWSDDNKVLGDTQDGSGKSGSYIGPALDISWRDRLTASAAWDIAFEGENKGLHGAADNRVRASLAYLF